MGRAHGKRTEYVTPAVSGYGFRECHTEKPERRTTMAEYIDRAAAVKSVLRMRRPENSVAQNRMLSIIQMDMLKLPAADVAPVVHGKWIVRFDGPYKRRRCYCSHCGKHNGVGGIAKNQEKPYCPNCGAKMDGGDNDAAD